MNIRLQRLPPEKRENYIRQNLAIRSMAELRHMVSQYGIHGVLKMKRQELEDAIVDALLGWANNGHNLPSYKVDVILPVPAYRPKNGTCAIPLCEKTLYRRGICSMHYYEYIETITGTYNPVWLEYLIGNQMSVERKMYNSEVPFSWMENGGEHIIGG